MRHCPHKILRGNTRPRSSERQSPAEKRIHIHPQPCYDKASRPLPRLSPPHQTRRPEANHCPRPKLPDTPRRGPDNCTASKMVQLRDGRCQEQRGGGEEGG